MNIETVRTFVRLRNMLQANADLARKLAELEAKCDAQFKVVFDALRQLMALPAPSKKRRIGFEVKESPAAYKRSTRRPA